MQVSNTGKSLQIAGLTVLRKNDLWYYSTKYGLKQVVLRDGRWYYA